MYQIAILPHYYQPDIQGNERPHILDTIYDTDNDAQATIDALEAGVYYLSHGESGRPTYLIVPVDDANYIVSGRNEDASNYDWDNAQCYCGDCNTCCAMMISQDRDYLTSMAIS